MMLGSQLFTFGFVFIFHLGSVSVSFFFLSLSVHLAKYQSATTRWYSPLPHHLVNHFSNFLYSSDCHLYYRFIHILPSYQPCTRLCICALFSIGIRLSPTSSLHGSFLYRIPLALWECLPLHTGHLKKCQYNYIIGFDQIIMFHVLGFLKLSE